MTPRSFDRAVLIGAALVAALFLLIALAGTAQAAKPVYVSEQRMELILSATETPVGTFEGALCLGIGKPRGYHLPRYAKFVCSAFIYPDTHVIMRTRVGRSGRAVVFG